MNCGESDLAIHILLLLLQIVEISVSCKRIRGWAWCTPLLISVMRSREAARSAGRRTPKAGLHSNSKRDGTQRETTAIAPKACRKLWATLDCLRKPAMRASEVVEVSARPKSSIMTRRIVEALSVVQGGLTRPQTWGCVTQRGRRRRGWIWPRPV